jgi:hypothetical protein
VVLYTGSTIVKPDQISIYPNPSNGSITIEYPFTGNTGEEANISIIDITGKEVYACKITGYINIIELPNVFEGLYFIKLENGTQTDIQKIIIKY